MKVAFFSTKSYDTEYFGSANGDHNHDITFFEARLKHRTAHLATGFEAVCVFVNDEMDRETISVLKQHDVRLIALRAAGFNNVDLKAAGEAGILVVRVPAYSPQAIAEHALALILTLNRKTHKAYNRVREGNFSLERLTGFNLAGKTCGVIGTGRIGSVLCRIMTGLGCTVLGYDQVRSEELEQAGVVYCGLEKLLSESDIVSLHCPLTPETAYIINKQTLSMMKKGAMLINTSRGALVNTYDTIQALKSGHLGYLGIDVYEQEEKLFFRDHSEEILQDDQIAWLMTFPNVLITAHQAFFTREALQQIAHTTLKNISDFEAGNEMVNAVIFKAAR